MSNGKSLTFSGQYTAILDLLSDTMGAQSGRISDTQFSQLNSCGSTLTIASNVEQTANILCAQNKKIYSSI